MGREPRDSPPVLLSPGAQQLTSEQQEVLRGALAGHSVLFTGGAGSGKSFLLRQICSRLDPRYTFITAPTGIAACNVGGVTIHHWAGIGGSAGRSLAEVTAHAARKRGAQWRAARTLVIDEISMLDGDLFDQLEAIARAVRGIAAPFGGLQSVRWT